MTMQKMLTQHAVMIGLFAVALYALCLIWPSIYPYSEDVLVHHMLSLKLLFPGFSGYGTGSIAWGAILSFVYGFSGSIVFHMFHEKCCKMKK